jgi:hypothetical protein
MEDMSALLKRRFVEQIKVMFGSEPSKPKEIGPAAQKIHFYKKGNRDLIAEKLHARAHATHKNTWRNRRWATLLFANLLFTFSFFLDIQILEGALTASRFVGFHLIDLNSALQVLLAHKHIINNLLIGTGTVLDPVGAARRAHLLLLGLPLSPAGRVGGENPPLSGQEKAGHRPDHGSPLAQRLLGNFRSTRLCHRLHRL